MLIKKQYLLFKYQKENLNKLTKYEKQFEILLNSINIKYIPQKGFFNNNSFYLIDFYIPKPYKICFEIDGEYHKNQIKYDKERDNFLINIRKFNVIHLPNHIIPSLTKKNIISILSETKNKSKILINF